MNQQKGQTSKVNSHHWDRGFPTRMPMNRRKEHTSQVYFFSIHGHASYKLAFPAHEPAKGTNLKGQFTPLGSRVSYPHAHEPAKGTNLEGLFFLHSWACELLTRVPSR
jgi:hypothetical protein